jgi:hypothetical protein
MEKEFIPYKQALALKELGFDELVSGYYYALNKPKEEVQTVQWTKMNSEASCHIPEYYISAPLYQQAFRWFREKHTVFSHIGKCMGVRTESYFVEINTITEMLGIYDSEEDQVIFRSHSEAELECLKNLIEIVRNK